PPLAFALGFKNLGVSVKLKASAQNCMRHRSENASSGTGSHPRSRIPGRGECSYPFPHALRDPEKPANASIGIRGEPINLGEEAPRRFLRILSADEPRPFTKGSGRLEDSEIANHNLIGLP